MRWDEMCVKEAQFWVFRRDGYFHNTITLMGKMEAFVITTMDE